MLSELTLSVALLELLICVLVVTYVWSRDRSRRDRAHRMIRMLVGFRRSRATDNPYAPRDE
jgi:hypothetical protein